MIGEIAVIVPARDEEDEIIGCIEAILASFARLEDCARRIRQRVIVVADACTDSTAEAVAGLAAVHPSIEVLSTTFANVGRARNAAGDHVLSSTGRQVPSDRAATAPEEVWLAFTDADSRVPEHWISTHLEHAEADADCLVGTVAPRIGTGPADLLARWHDAHELRDDHPYVFGANLGLRGSLFTRIGGVPPLACGEDAAIVAAVLEAGGQVRRTDAGRVLTSARLTSRTTGGFSAYLQRLVEPTDAGIG